MLLSRMLTIGFIHIFLQCLLFLGFAGFLFQLIGEFEMLEDLVKLCQVRVINVEFVKSLEIAFHMNLIVFHGSV